MDEPLYLSYEEQLELFAARGMKVKEHDVKKLEHVNYYRLKEFARPLSKTRKENGVVVVDYTGISFKEVLTRYYQDKNLRINLLHAIEKVEISLKTKIAQILGESLGAYGYLNFSSWTNRAKFSRFEIEERQYNFKKNLLKVMRHARSADLTNRNKNKDGFPIIWLALDLLMFGDLIRMLEIMSNKNLKKIAACYACEANELISWMKCLHFVRNICAHNSNIIDLKLKTTPIQKSEWSNILFMLKDKHGEKRQSNRLAIVLLIVYHLVSQINEHYKWKNLKNNIKTICAGKEKNANLLGFSSIEASKKVFKTEK
ncbi:Abi family protein [Enterococcus faecium]|uniref:Abi family protein n=1 Tax=Enterococcus faecium TaxID=1352 RepID=UPI0018845DB9|nr:Abi family protein [Enterococcus faecium]MBE9862490.1 Abi family protein [Enterococcus faecium]MDQ8516405.1 Abi family protein [Enterococcus faecium]